MRKAEVNRSTGETQVQLYLDLDGSGWSEIDTGIGFMDHMLVLLAKHAGFDLKVKCQGDVYVDDHHSVEDIGISLGLAFAKALGDKQGICRYGDTTLAMDEALILTSLDISGRSYLDYRMEIPTEKVGTFDLRRRRIREEGGKRSRHRRIPRLQPENRHCFRCGWKQLLR